jgi:hypothetical protein
LIAIVGFFYRGDSAAQIDTHLEIRQPKPNALRERKDMGSTIVNNGMEMDILLQSTFIGIVAFYLTMRVGCWFVSKSQRQQ